jgi:2,3-bisphosphoglycerate-independent phosphoglycerate mutase
VETLRAHWEEYDYFFFHVKKTDSAGEDGDFQRKAGVIQHVDEAVIPAILALDPDVLIVTGDHSTPAVLKSHSWHPVPTLLWSRYCRPDGIAEFGERICGRGSLGVFAATDELPLALGHALRFAKYGA